jgi:hypothetical protein
VTYQIVTKDNLFIINETKLYMKKTLLFLCLTYSGINLLFAQDQNGIQAGGAKRMNIQGTYLGFAIPKSDDIELLPMMTPVVSKNESKDESALKLLKEEKMKEKEAAIQAGLDEESTNAQKTRGLDPTLIVGYNALGNQGTPSDNSCAVNKSGQLIAVVNSSIRTYNTNTGAGIGSIVGLQNFFSSISNGSLLTTNTCDPKVIFDPQADRFIVFAQTCAGNSSSSQLLLAFSKTANPSDGFYFYQFSGNQSAAIGTNVWFDYPKIGVSNHDVFVTGNLFTNNYDYEQSVIYQIDKTKCYAGQSLAAADASLWYNIANSPFTMVPMTNGQGGGYGNNMFLVSTDQTLFGTNLAIYEITNAVQNNPQIIDQYVTIPSAPSPADGIQQGTNVDLQIGDNRGMDGFYLNGTIHYVFHSDAGSGYSGVNYSRLKKNGSNWQLQNNKVIKITGKDCAFPSIASMGWTNTDQSALIHFLCSSNSDFPGMRAVFVNDNFQESNPIMVKAGTGYASVFPQNGVTRWGDYSGASRELNASVPTVWVFGMYGNTNNTWTNNFAKISTGAWPTDVEDVQENTESKVQVFPNPIEDVYSIQLDLPESGKIEIDLFDMNGRFVRHVYASQISKGNNLFSFNKGPLANGQYVLQFKLNNQPFKNEKISVTGR